MACDFPRAWEIANATPAGEHNPRCSYRVTIGALLCDCEILTSHPDYADEVLHGRGGTVRASG